MTDLSVVIVNWNTRELLRGCLASLAGTIRELAVEVFVVDNASSDGSPQMVRSEFPSVTVIENDRNLGFARANNIALRMATGRYWLLLNSDTLVRAGSIEGLLTAMERDPAIGIAGLQLLDEDGSLQNSVSNIPSLVTELGNKSLLRRLCPARFPGKEHRLESPVEVESVIGACMMVRREAADTVGLLDEDFFFFLEETDWCLRMRRAGWKVVHDPRYTIVHLQGRSAARVNVRARIEYWRSRYTFFRKHRGPLARAALRVGLLARLAGSLLGAGILRAASGFTASGPREKLRVASGILAWHARGCPADGGLEPTDAESIGERSERS